MLNSSNHQIAANAAAAYDAAHAEVCATVKCSRQIHRAKWIMVTLLLTWGLLCLGVHYVVEVRSHANSTIDPR